MATGTVTPVKWFAAVLFREQAIAEAALLQLTQQWSTLDFRSVPIPFASTDYYQEEMGPELHRVIVGFAQLGPPDRLVGFKLLTASLEREYSRNGNRLINIDPGYLDLFKVVLASFKARGNKIYLGNGVWADFTLYYRKSAFHSLPWSFPDFRQGHYDRDLKKMRDLYKRALAGKT